MLATQVYYELHYIKLQNTATHKRSYVFDYITIFTINIASIADTRISKSS